MVSPKKMLVFLAAMAVVGNGFTLRVRVMTESQQLADATVLVYVFCVVKLWLPNVYDDPWHMAALMLAAALALTFFMAVLAMI